MAGLQITSEAQQSTPLAASQSCAQGCQSQALQPLLAPTSIQETMVQYFARLGQIVDRAQYSTCKHMVQPGIYLYKRPVFTPAGGPSPLAMAGSVYHHCVVFIKEASGQIHSIDFGPGNGCDVTSNIMESVPARECLARHVQPPESAAPADNHLPYLYLGQPQMCLDDEQVAKALKLAESRPYNAIRNNCIHFADAIVRLLTNGKVRSAPLIFDLLCGEVPATDNPTLLMLQMMLQASWMSVCDGSTLYSAMVGEAPKSVPVQQAATSAVPASNLAIQQTLLSSHAANNNMNSMAATSANQTNQAQAQAAASVAMQLLAAFAQPPVSATSHASAPAETVSSEN